MSKVVVIGFPGDATLYVADIAAGTVQPLKSPSSGPLASASSLRDAGATVVKDVNFAVAVASSEQAFSGVFDA